MPVLEVRPCRLFGGDEQQQGRPTKIVADNPRISKSPDPGQSTAAAPAAMPAGKASLRNTAVASIWATVRNTP